MNRIDEDLQFVGVGFLHDAMAEVGDVALSAEFLYHLLDVVPNLILKHHE